MASGTEGSGTEMPASAAPQAAPQPPTADTAQNAVTESVVALPPGWSPIAAVTEDPLGFARDFWLEIVAGVVLLALAALIPWLWRLTTRALGRFALRLGTAWPLRRLAVRVYLRRVRDRHGTLYNVYLDKEDKLDLAQVFVPLRLLERGDGGLDRDLPLTTGTRTVLTAPNDRRLIILGAPGSGKTTLLKALASGVSQRQWPELGALVPVYVRLRAYAQADGRPDLWAWVGARVGAEFGVRNAGALLDVLAGRGRILLLLDGLDEIGEDAARWVPAQIAAVAGRLARDPGSRLIVSCREQNYDLLEDPELFTRAGFAVYRLAEMRDAEVEAMVARRAPDFAAHNKSGTRFLGKVRAAPNIADLHRNPLMLTLSIGLYLHRVDDEVPHDLAEFYEQSIRNLLTRHDARSSEDRREGLHTRNLTPHRDKLALLERFGLEALLEATHEHRDFEVWPVADLIQDAHDMAGERIGIRAEQAEILVQEIHRNAGLISDTGDGDHFCFAHRSLHEFCAARELAKRGDAGFQLARVHFVEPDWAQVLIFYASLDHDDAARLVEYLLEDLATSLVQRLALAGQCAAVLVHPLTDLRLRVADAIAEGLESAPDSQAARLLLDALIRLGRDAAEPVRERVEHGVRAALDVDRPERITAELGRLDKTTALAILDLLIDSGEPERLHAARIGLEVMSGVEPVPTLWRLIGALASRGEQKELQRALFLLMTLLANADAADRLRAQSPLPGDPLDEQSVRRVFPFTPAGERPDNLAAFLALCQSAFTDFSDEPDLLERVLMAGATGPCSDLIKRALEPKDRRHQRAWEQLPLDRSQSMWRLPRRTLAQLALLALLGVGAVQIALFLHQHPALLGDLSRSGGRGWPMLLPGWLLVGAVLTLLWEIWARLTRRLDWWSDQGGFCPAQVSRWLRPGRLLGEQPDQRLLEAHGEPPGVPLAGRIAFLSGAALLVPIVLFVTHPHTSGQSARASGIVVDRGGQVVVAVASRSNPLILDADSGEQLPGLPANVRFDANRAGLSADGRTVVMPESDTVLLRDPQTGAALGYLPPNLGEAPSRRGLPQVGRRVTTAAFSADSRLIGAALVSKLDPRDHDIEVWDAATGAHIAILKRWGMRDLDNIAFSPDGRYVLFGGFNGDEPRGVPEVYVWNMGRKDIRYVIAFMGGEIQALEFSPTGRAALVLLGESVWALETATWKPIGFVGDPAGLTVEGAAFSPDGSTIAFSAGSNVYLWDYASDGEPRRFGQESELQHVAWTPDGQNLLLGAADGTVRMIDPTSGETVWNAPSHYAYPANIDLWDLIVFLLLVVAFVFFPTTKFFDPGRWLYIWPLRPNPYLYLYDLPGIEHYIPVHPRRPGPTPKQDADT